MTVRVRIQDEALKRALRDLGNADERIAKKALERTSFEVLDALKLHVTGIFKGPRTKFVAGAFRFKVRRDRRGILVSEFWPRPKASRILGRHLDGRFYDARHKLLAIERRNVPARAGAKRMPNRRMLAIPEASAITRGASGRIPVRLTPGRLLRSGGRTYLSADGRLLLRRLSDHPDARSEVLYHLRRQAKNEPRFKFAKTVADTARRVLPGKLAEELKRGVRTR